MLIERVNQLEFECALPVQLKEGKNTSKPSKHQARKEQQQLRKLLGSAGVNLPKKSRAESRAEGAGDGAASCRACDGAAGGVVCGVVRGSSAVSLPTAGAGPAESSQANFDIPIHSSEDAAFLPGTSVSSGLPLTACGFDELESSDLSDMY